MTTADKQPVMDPNAFEAALGVIASPQSYLGDAATVETLIRMGLQDILSAIGGDDFQETVKGVCRRTAGILLGDAPNYTPEPSLNAPGKIDDLCATWFGTAETDPHKRMEHVVLQCYMEVLDILPDQGQDIAPGAREQMRTTIGKYAAAFVGISPAMYAILAIDRPGAGAPVVDDFEPIPEEEQ